MTFQKTVGETTVTTVVTLLLKQVMVLLYFFLYFSARRLAEKQLLVHNQLSKTAQNKLFEIVVVWA